MLKLQNRLTTLENIFLFIAIISLNSTLFGAVYLCLSI